LNVEKKRSLVMNTAFKRRSKFFTEENESVLKTKKDSEIDHDQPSMIGKNYHSVSQMPNK